MIEKIGEGGMGVVWRATDTTLDREVAIKVLPEAFTGDSDRLARFEREARLLATMSHPAIAAVYGAHEHEGTRFIALELVPGETLADRLAGGPLPLDEVLELAHQVADGLEAAHENGLIHRDLKPANIQITPDGAAKVLDFGLAKSLQGRAAKNLSSSPTETAARTAVGAIMGTPAYMSPEQARGKQLDRRTDIWSFGCVLFEMFTGRPCFGGETVSDTLARILETEPDWTLLPRRTPPALRAMLRRALEKDPRRRLRDIGEFRVELEDRGRGPVPEEKAQRSGLARALPWVAAAVGAVGALAVGWVALECRRAPRREPVRMAVNLPQDHRLAIANDSALAVSPDGSRLVFAASSPPGSSPRLFVRELGAFEIVALPGTEGAVGPFFSPDGRWLGYFADEVLKKIAVEGGTPLEICHVGQVVPGATWGEDDLILFSGSPDSGLFRVPATGGSPETLTTPARADGESAHGWPDHLPGGESVVFTVRHREGTRIAVLSLATSEWTALFKGMGGARFLPSGYLIFARSEGLVAVPFDAKGLRATGEPVVVLDDVYTIGALKGTGLAAFDVSDNGVLVYMGGGAEAGENRLVWIDREGRTRPAFAEPGGYEWPRLSPDGLKIAVTNRSPDGGIDIWVLDVARDARSRLTLEGNDILPVWEPDGSRVAFGSIRGDSAVSNVYWKTADGSGETTRLVESDHPRFPRDWSPDGSVLAMVEWNPETGRDIWVFETGGAGQPRPLIVTPANEFSPVFSPDGRRLAYVSDESGRLEVYVESFPRGRGRWLVSAGGGLEPLWAADGRELFYRAGDAMVAVTVRTAPSFSVGAPRILFERSLKAGIYDTLSYDVTDDGREFLMIERPHELVPGHLQVVLAWDEELRQRVPSG